MIREEWFYCLSCCTETPIERSGIVFRTGYYRCLMRLGLCASCAEPEPVRVCAPAGQPENPEAGGDHMAPELP